MSIDYKREILIDRRSSKPIHQQIIISLEKLLSSARVLNNESLISAEELAKILEVDVKDVKKAYEILKRDKFISYDDMQIPYVSKYYRILGFFNRLVQIEDGILQLNKKPSSELLNFEIVEIEKSHFIPVDHYNDKRFLKQSRLFKADGEPYIYLEEFYPIDRFKKLLDVDASLAGHIYDEILIPEYNIDFRKTDRFVNVDIHKKEIAHILNIDQGLPGFRIDMVYLDQNNEPFGFSQTYSLPHFYFEYDVHL